MKNRRQSGRFFYGLISVLAMMSAGWSTGPTMTTITDVVYRANGQPANGSIVVSWPTFTTADNKPVAAGELTIQIGAQGTVSFALVPNEGGDPGGTYYKAVYKLTDGTTSTEYWVVSAATPTTIAAIRASVVPRQVGAQFVSRQYVDTAVANTDEQVVHKSGSESITGVKNFAASPVVPAPASGVAAVNRDYVDAQVTQLSEGFIQKNGDSMTGPLILPGEPVSANQAANRQYVDIQAASLNSGLSLKLGRFGDTPVNLAAVRYASQFGEGQSVSAKIDAACADLGGSHGLVIIPSSMSTGSPNALPANCNVWDLRQTSGYNQYGTYSPSFKKATIMGARWVSPVAQNETFSQLQLSTDVDGGGCNLGYFGCAYKANYETLKVNTRMRTAGQAHGLTSVVQAFGAGDALGVYGGCESLGGHVVGNGDEGCIGLRSSSGQDNKVFTSTVSSVGTNTISYPDGALNENTIGVGRYLLNLSSTYTTGTATPTYSGTTVTAGAGADWSAMAGQADWCFTVTSENNGTLRYVVPVTTVTAGTLTLSSAWSINATTVASAYTLVRCSQVMAVDPNANTITVSNGAVFSAGNPIELNASHLWYGEGVKIFMNQQVASSNFLATGISISNGNSTLKGRLGGFFAAGGNARRSIEFNGHTIAPDYGLLWNNGPAPGTLVAAYDNADTATMVMFDIGRRGATGGTARFTYHNSSDQWSLGSSSGNAYYFKTNATSMGIGITGQAGTALYVTPAGTDNAFTIGGNSTGHLLNASIAGVPRFYLSNALAMFNNGIDLKGYSDNQTTLKWQITGSTGRASFNGGLCMDTAQTICDTSGAGAPNGVCVTGSTYKRTDGGSGTSLYVCESASWVAHGGATPAVWNTISNPSGAQALSMAAHTTTWTWNAATGSSVDMFRLTDSASNTGTGRVLSVETAANSNAKPFIVKPRGSTALEINEFGTITTLSGITLSAGLTFQVGGTLTLKGRDDWNAAVNITGSDGSGTSTIGSMTTVRGGDATSSTGNTSGGNLLLRGGGVSSASGTNGALQVAQTYLKDTMVTSGLLQCFKAAAAMTVGDCGNSAINSVGVAISASSTNPVVVEFQGIATLQFDGTVSPSAGWFACSSSSVGGKVTAQSGACAAGRQVGIVAQNGTSITSGKVFLQAR